MRLPTNGRWLRLDGATIGTFTATGAAQTNLCSLRCHSRQYLPYNFSRVDLGYQQDLYAVHDHRRREN